MRVHALWERVGSWLAAPLERRGAAIEAFERALAAWPEDAALLARLGDLYLLDAQHEAAVRCFEGAAAHAGDPELARNARRRLAGVLAGSLGERRRARALLEAVVSEAPHDVAARRALVAIHRARGDVAAAVAECRALAGLVGTAEERAVLQYEIAELHDASGDREAAFAARLEAVTIEGPEGPGAAMCRGSLADATRGKAYLAALAAWAAAYPEAVGADYHREVARVRATVLGRPEEGLAALAAAVVAAPRDLALQEALVEALVASGALVEALQAARSLVLADVGRGSAWRALRAACVAGGREDLARRAAAVLVATGQATEGERAAAAALQWSGAPAVRGLTPDVLRKIGDERPDTWASERLLAALTDYVARVYPEAIEALELERYERVDPGAGPPLWAEAARVARVFGVEAFALLVSPEPGARVRAVPGAPAQVLVPAGFDAAPAAARGFELARAFALIGRGMEAIELLDDGALAALMAASERLVNPELPEPAGVRADILEELERRLARSVPRRARRYLDDCASDALREGPVDLRAWRRALWMTANRAALLVCDDLGAVLPVLRTMHGLGFDAPRDALAFWVSEAADRVRREHGVSAG